MWPFSSFLSYLPLFDPLLSESGLNLLQQQELKNSKVFL